MSKKLPRRIKESLIMSRDGKRFAPPHNSIVELTEAEINEITALNADILGRVTQEELDAEPLWEPGARARTAAAEPAAPATIEEGGKAADEGDGKKPKKVKDAAPAAPPAPKGDDDDDNDL